MSTTSTSSNGSGQWIPQTAEGRYYKLEKITNLLKQTFPSKSEAEFQVTLANDVISWNSPKKLTASQLRTVKEK